MKKICFFNLKGGCAKTTSIINIVSYLAMKNNKILVVDCDMQSNLTSSLINYDMYRPGIFQVFTGEKDINEVIIRVKDNIDLLPSSLLMSTLEPRINGIYGREFILQRALNKLHNNYDYIFYDSSPSFSLVTTNAIVASDNIIVPVQTEYFAVEGVKLLLETLNYIKEGLNIQTELKYLFATMHDTRNNLNTIQYENLKKVFKDKFLDTYIRKNVALAESPIFKQSIFEYKPHSNGAYDYELLIKEIESKGGF
jgi:chromosome partitioning protein